MAAVSAFCTFLTSLSSSDILFQSLDARAVACISTLMPDKPSALASAVYSCLRDLRYSKNGELGLPGFPGRSRTSLRH